MRTGLVVGLSIPLVLAMTFAAMYLFDVGLHKISLGALLIALGLLVDDAIIAVEMMAVKMEQGLDRLHAASFTWTRSEEHTSELQSLMRISYAVFCLKKKKKKKHTETQ